jgi:flagellar M-ring protein FliF
MAALLLVLRPMVLRLTAPVPRVPALPGMAGGAMLAGGALPPGGAETGALLGAANPATGELPFLGGVAGALEDESMVRIANIEGQMRASSIRRLGELIDKHPEESLSIVRSWMQQERR